MSLARNGASIPSVCAERIVGKPSIDSPRIQSESGVLSTHPKAASIGVTTASPGRSTEQAEDGALYDQREQPMAAVDHRKHRLALLEGIIHGD